jgi:hypothetical protein
MPGISSCLFNDECLPAVIPAKSHADDRARWRIEFFFHWIRLYPEIERLPDGKSNRLAMRIADAAACKPCSGAKRRK